MHGLNTLPNDNILDLILGSIFKSINIELTNVEHHTNITNLHKYVNNCKVNQTNKTLKKNRNITSIKYWRGRHKSIRTYEPCNTEYK